LDAPSLGKKKLANFSLVNKASKEKRGKKRGRRRRPIDGDDHSEGKRELPGHIKTWD